MRIIAGKYKRRKLFTPKGIQTRPSTDRLRETLMAILEGGRFGFPLNSNLIIDVFAGTGALGIEAASRGHPNKVIFIEKNSNAVKIIEENIKITKSNELFEILNIDLSQIATWKFEKAGLVFLDPPYFSDLVEKALIKLKEIDAILPDAIIVAEVSIREKSKFIKNFRILFSKKLGKSMINFYKYSPSFE
tara:strand:- start:421 stop:990 length:570 start_codon:yes stop_codon:yes gene_type:complete